MILNQDPSLEILQLNDGDHLILANGDADIISIVDGQTWNDPTTWNCNCVPNSGTSISSGLYSFIGGNWDNSLGTFNYSSDDSTTFDGNSPSSISGSTDWQILTIDNSAGVSIASGTHNIFGILNLVSGSFNTANSVTLKSDVSGTAQMDDIESGSIIGNITVE